MVDYNFYTTHYLGDSITGDEWPLYEKRAGEELNRYKRIYTVTAPETDSENMAVCAMADALAFFAAAQNGTEAVKSASIGSVSVSYDSSVDISPKGQAKELYRCASLYLEISRGVG